LFATNSHKTKKFYRGISMTKLAAEHHRILSYRKHGLNWKKWGPYLSERAWGTVRDDYSADGSAWDFFPHDHARSKAYRWGEDGIAGISDRFQYLCFALALWNGRDAILRLYEIANETPYVKDEEGKNVFQGGFLGFDNISVFNRSAPLPTGGHIDQSDGTAWMGFYSLVMLKIALELAMNTTSELVVS